ncbi:MAG: hypothetical protein QOD13_1041 [Thermoleophilaceae bacterium]|nr:hypothetical protein [Thermoleophilaceae bacterium]
MNREVIVTCAVTGSGDTVGTHPGVPVTPRQIADACREAADAGAAIVHIHVRDPETGAPSREPDLFRQAVELVRADGTDAIINLTTGLGGDFYPSDDEPAVAGPGSDMLSPLERLVHLEGVDIDCCTLDCGTMNWGDDGTYIATLDMLRTMADRIRELGIKPEMEVFDLGHVRNVQTLVEEGRIEGRPLVQICLGVGGGAGVDSFSMLAMQRQLPPDALWFGFGVGREEFPMVAQAALFGGNVRVGLEDNLYLSRGRLATNGELVERAVTIVQSMGAQVASTDRAREILGLS